VVVVVSNQRGVALGQMSTTDLDAVDARLRALTGIEHSYYCTHGLERCCDCRKPRAGLLIRAAAALGLDLAASWMVGDRPTDRDAGQRAGCRTLLVEPEDGALLAAAHRIVAATAAPA
jgi:D-glycero-D-manno-heptose 1,7-bisphosphate phosphatase